MYKLKHHSSMMYIFDNCNGNIYGTCVTIEHSHVIIKNSKYLHTMKIKVIVYSNKIYHNKNCYNMSMDINISIHCLDVGLFELTRYSSIIAINNNNLNNYDTMFGKIYSRQILCSNNSLLTVNISFGLIELRLGNINIVNSNILVTRNITRYTNTFETHSEVVKSIGLYSIFITYMKLIIYPPESLFYGVNVLILSIVMMVTSHTISEFSKFIDTYSDNGALMASISNDISNSNLSIVVQYVILRYLFTRIRNTYDTNFDGTSNYFIGENYHILTGYFSYDRDGANDGFIWDDYHMNTDNDYENSGWRAAQPYDENNENDVDSSILLLVQEIEELERVNQNCCYKCCYCNYKYCQHCNKYCVNLKAFYYLVLNLIFGSIFMVLNHILAYFNPHDDTNIIKLLNIVDYLQSDNSIINVLIYKKPWNKNCCDLINCDRIFKWCLIYNCIIALSVQDLITMSIVSIIIGLILFFRVNENMCCFSNLIKKKKKKITIKLYILYW